MRSLSCFALATTVGAAALVAACSTATSGSDGTDTTDGTETPEGTDAGVSLPGPDASADAGIATPTPTPTPDSGAAPDPQAIAAGSALVTAQGCNTTACHGADLSGNIRQPSGAYSANLTPDPTTGIAGWTVADLTAALQDGVDDDGKALCASMPRFAQLTATNIADIYAYLESIPAVTKARTSTACSE
jgi:hypothetical protein